MPVGAGERGEVREQAWGWAGVGRGRWPWACSHSYLGPEGLEWARLGTSWGQVLGWEDQARRRQGGRHPQNPCTHAEALAGAMGRRGMERSTENFKAPGFSGAAGPLPQTDKTVIVINIFNLNYMMCVEGARREGEKKTDKGRDEQEMRVQETNQTVVAVKARLWDGGEEAGDRQRQRGREDSQRPEHAALLVPPE